MQLKELIKDQNFRCRINYFRNRKSSYKFFMSLLNLWESLFFVTGSRVPVSIVDIEKYSKYWKEYTYSVTMETKEFMRLLPPVCEVQLSN